MKKQQLMNASWASKYPPLSLDEYIYPTEEIRLQMEQFVRTGNINGNLILLGPTGIGKSSFIRMIKSEFEKTNTRRTNVPMTVEKFDMETISLLKKLPSYVSTTKKLVFMEEFEMKRMHTDRFAGELKLLIDQVEFQLSATIIATSNSLHGFEDAMKRRFTIIELTNEKTNYKQTQIVSRFGEILKNESIVFSEEDLGKFVDSFPYFDIRQMMNFLYDASITGTLVVPDLSDFGSDDVGSAEMKLAKGNVNIYKSLLNYTNVELKKLYEDRLPNTNELKLKFQTIQSKMYALILDSPNIRAHAVLDLMLDKNLFPELGPVATINVVKEITLLGTQDILLHKYTVMKIPSIMLKSIINEY